MSKYNGNDIFKPFNAGLYGIDGDEYQSLQYEDTKSNILSEFKREYEKDIIAALSAAGLKYIGLEYWSPREYNFATDSIDLELEVENEALLLKALEQHRPAIEKAMADNKSYDGYMALTADSWNKQLEKATGGRGPDILAVTAILSGIEFDPELLHEWIVWEYQCDDCKLIHADAAEYYDESDKKTVADCEAKQKAV